MIYYLHEMKVLLHFVQCCCKFVLGCNILNILILYMYIACDMQASKYEDKSHQKIFTIYEIFINRMCIDKVRNFDLKKKRK